MVSNVWKIAKVGPMRHKFSIPIHRIAGSTLIGGFLLLQGCIYPAVEPLDAPPDQPEKAVDGNTNDPPEKVEKGEDTAAPKDVEPEQQEAKVEPEKKVREKKRKAPPVPEYSQIYFYKSAMTNRSLDHLDVGDAHVVSWERMKPLKKIPTDSEGLFLFGADHLFKVQKSFKRALPDDTVVVRQARYKLDHFDPEDTWFKAFAWSQRLYEDRHSLMLFNKGRDLIRIVPLPSRTQWDVPVGPNENIPLGVYLRLNGLPLPFDRNVPLKLFISPHQKTAAADGTLKLDVILMNRADDAVSICWPESFADLMKVTDIYFDIYKEANTYSAIKRPPARELTKNDYERVPKGLGLNYQGADLSAYYDLSNAKGIYNVRLFMHVSQTDFTSSEAGKKKGTIHGAWTGFIASNEIQIQL